jgi:hypothetical protein
MNFPLYTTLLTGLPSKDLTVAQKNDFVRRIDKLDSEAYDLIYALIKSYYLEHENGDAFTIPYEGILAKDRIDFDLLKLPITLRQLLYKFVTVHRKKLKEDKEILEIQSGSS